MSDTIVAASVLGRPGSNSVTIDRGRITAIGRLEGADHHAGPRPVNDGVIMAGIRDAHIHPSGYAGAVTGLAVADAVDFADLGERISEAASLLAPGIPLVASRLDEHRLREGRLPRRHDLDRMADDRPVFVTRYCGHVAVANTSALIRAGVTVDTPDPPGGSIDRDHDGMPDGVLRETAVGQVGAVLSPDVPSPEPARLLEAMSGLAGLGITRIHAIVSTGTALWCGSGSELDDLIHIAADLPIGVEVFVTASSRADLHASAERIEASDGLRWAGWKAFADGSLGGLTAAMERPFSDHAGSGTLRLDVTTATELAGATLDMGGTVAIHAIGDRANRAVLALYRSLKDGSADPSRCRVEHASVLSPELVGEFAATGITASVQPAFIGSEVTWLTERLGAERARWTYPFRSMLGAGVPLVAGSDSPVEDPNPWKAMAFACANPITPVESVDRRSAIAMYGSGTPTVGDGADIVVVDRDPLTTDDLAGTRVLATYVGGVECSATPAPWPG